MLKDSQTNNDQLSELYNRCKEAISIKRNSYFVDVALIPKNKDKNSVLRFQTTDRSEAWIGVQNKEHNVYEFKGAPYVLDDIKGIITEMNLPFVLIGADYEKKLLAVSGYYSEVWGAMKTQPFSCNWDDAEELFFIVESQMTSTQSSLLDIYGFRFNTKGLNLINAEYYKDGQRDGVCIRYINEELTSRVEVLEYYSKAYLKMGLVEKIATLIIGAVWSEDLKIIKGWNNKSYSINTSDFVSLTINRSGRSDTFDVVIIADGFGEQERHLIPFESYHEVEKNSEWIGELLQPFFKIRRFRNRMNGVTV